MSTLNQLVQDYQGRASAFWQARTEQERNFLGVGGAVLGAALAYALLVGPALDGGAKLRRDLPELRQQAAELQALAQEAQALNGQAMVAPPPMSRDSLATSLAAAGLKEQSIALTGEYAKVQLGGASFPALVNWLSDLRRDGRITVQDAAITAQSTAGMVDASLTLRQNTGGPK
jgi:general secretion pathway protein M